MDQTQAPRQQDFDIWEFVTCSKCQLPFSADGVSGPTVPFWITECGHVLCNTHLNADQSCPSCNAQGIELMPLQKEMPSPFSDWFTPLPFKLDALAQAAKFQYERIAGAARYYKSRCEQYRTLVHRMRDEVGQVKALKKENDALKNENAQLQGGWTSQQQNQGQTQNGQRQQEPASYVNINGKRRLVDTRMSTSSPRSITTPLGPPRITLPPDHEQPPSLARLGASETSSNGDGLRQQVSAARPPGSSHFTQQYAYNPPQTQQMHMQPQQVLSHAQQAPIRQQAQQGVRRLMPPPPTPIQSRQLGADQKSRQMQRVATPRAPNQIQVKQGSSVNQSMPLSTNDYNQQQFAQHQGSQSLGQAPRRFVPPVTSGSATNAGISNGHFAHSTPSGGARRFIPSTPSTSAGQRFVPSSSSGPVGTRGQAQGSGFSNSRSQRSTFAPTR